LPFRIYTIYFTLSKDRKDYSDDDINEIIKSNGYESKKRQLREILRPNNKEAEKKFTEIKEKTARILLVLSLSALKDNILMWIHYADSHKGFCIGFESNIDFIGFMKERYSINIEELGNSEDEIKYKKLLSTFNNSECLLFEKRFFVDNIFQDNPIIKWASEVASDKYKKELIYLPLYKIEYPSCNNMPEAYDFFKRDISSDPNIKKQSLKNWNLF